MSPDFTELSVELDVQLAMLLKAATLYAMLERTRACNQRQYEGVQGLSSHRSSMLQHGAKRGKVCC